MPTTKDLKRLVRARMQKTGEAYTAARAQVISKRVTLAAPAPAPITTEPAVAEFAKLAGMSDEKVKAATGCTWEKWVFSLDRKKAYELSHRELAQLIGDKYKTGAWWTQTVAVGYERIKGLRAKGQLRNRSFQATKSKTFNVPVGDLFDAWVDATDRKKWLDGGQVRVRTSSRPKSMRLEIDGAVIAVSFKTKGAGRSSVAIEQEKLPSPEAVSEVKTFWTERFDLLQEVLST